MSPSDLESLNLARAGNRKALASWIAKVADIIGALQKNALETFQATALPTRWKAVLRKDYLRQLLRVWPENMPQSWPEFVAEKAGSTLRVLLAQAGNALAREAVKEAALPMIWSLRKQMSSVTVLELKEFVGKVILQFDPLIGPWESYLGKSLLNKLGWIEKPDQPRRLDARTRKIRDARENAEEKLWRENPTESEIDRVVAEELGASLRQVAAAKNKIGLLKAISFDEGFHHSATPDETSQADIPKWREQIREALGALRPDDQDLLHLIHARVSHAELFRASGMHSQEELQQLELWVADDLRAKVVELNRQCGIPDSADEIYEAALAEELDAHREATIRFVEATERWIAANFACLIQPRQSIFLLRLAKVRHRVIARRYGMSYAAERKADERARDDLVSWYGDASASLRPARLLAWAACRLRRGWAKQWRPQKGRQIPRVSEIKTWLSARQCGLPGQSAQEHSL